MPALLEELHMSVRVRDLALVLTAAIVGLLVLPASALAQTPPAASSYPSRHEGVGVGAKIGPLWSNVDVASAPDVTYGSRSGLIGGLFIGGNRPGIVGVG